MLAGSWLCCMCSMSPAMQKICRRVRINFYLMMIIWGFFFCKFPPQLCTCQSCHKMFISKWLKSQFIAHCCVFSVWRAGETFWRHLLSTFQMEVKNPPNPKFSSLRKLQKYVTSCLLGNSNYGLIVYKHCLLDNLTAWLVISKRFSPHEGCWLTDRESSPTWLLAKAMRFGE